MRVLSYFWANKTTTMIMNWACLWPAASIGCKNVTACICCWAPCCGPCYSSPCLRPWCFKAAPPLRQRDRQTDRRTDIAPLDRPRSAYYAGSVSKLYTGVPAVRVTIPLFRFPVIAVNQLHRRQVTFLRVMGLCAFGPMWQLRKGYTLYSLEVTLRKCG